jgi:hypothetical protein
MLQMAQIDGKKGVGSGLYTGRSDVCVVNVYGGMGGCCCAVREGSEGTRGNLYVLEDARVL